MYSYIRIQICQLASQVTSICIITVSQAIDCYTKAAVNTESNLDSVLVNRAIAYVMLQDIESALSDFKEAILVNPDSAHAHFNRGNLYRSLEEFKKAEEDYKQGSLTSAAFPNS